MRERLAKFLAEGQKCPIKFPRNKMVFSCFTLSKDLSPKFGSFHICGETKTRSNCISVNYASLHSIYRTDHVFTRKTEIVLSCYTPKHVANHDPHISAGFPLFFAAKQVSGMHTTPRKRDHTWLAMETACFLTHLLHV